MRANVKRPYASELRASQARTTRRTIVDAAARLFVERGYGATTMDAIAEAAGVSRKTVFMSVGSKAQALKLAIDWAIVGDDEPIPMLERPRIKAAERDPDARRMLADYAAVICEVGARLAPLDAVLQAAAGLDPELRALAEQGRRQRLTGVTVIAEHLGERKVLKGDLTIAEAADILWLYNDPGVYRRLVMERGWSHDRLERWLADTLAALILDPRRSPRAPRERPR